MKIIEFLMAGSFRNTDKGDTLYFPWGIFGSGYILDTAARKKKILYVSAGQSVLAGIIILTVYQKFDWMAIWFLLPPYWLCHMIATFLLTRGLQKTDEKLTYRQSLEEVAKKAGFGLMVVMVMASLGGLAIGIWMIGAGINLGFGLLMLVASFVLGLMWCYLIIRKRTHT
ncbi:hypothetical protein NBZ79_00295 [Sneathiella marina]|uniref:MFS transporter n=1 Tax=Sneathiella marina TaxID=2950108 RepID=A0ABY4W814_9PROT|nr:hypothetical protein [Sneathiella marina]USG61414.1 hypothetical protein NBZ79_00295 [Sneathiella marina]